MTITGASAAPPPETQTPAPLGEAVPVTGHVVRPLSLNIRPLAEFQVEQARLLSFWIFLVLFFVSLFAELITNDRPFLVKFDGHLYWPGFRHLFGDDLRR